MLPRHLSAFRPCPLLSRPFSAAPVSRHENPLGLPQRGAPPQIPRRGGPIEKRPIANVRKVIAVASGKGGVGKSTVAVNLAFGLSDLRDPDTSARLRVGILDLDIFGPSVPTLMGLQDSGEPELTSAGALRPLVNHGLPTMSMGYLLPRAPESDSSHDTPVVWRGLMVQKAVQQLLFDVDWSMGQKGAALDVLVVDMPPGTGDVPLTLGQLVKVDGALIVSTPQDVSLADVRKGIAMLRKVSVPITGLLLNNAHYICPTCSITSPSPPTPQYLFGPPDRFRATAARLGIPILAELPLVPGVSAAGDKGVPYGLVEVGKREEDGRGGMEWIEGMKAAAAKVWEAVEGEKREIS
ncbi:putative P-loop containing nucleoside triphosphate hydrolase protein [Lyophyllum shimeji]|uniref:P-loop containing nucleoside triphosphate hydrolase protein n=1 Tax=Lyophyllum shimeji TaxID=47721 RepID=A0A9P3PTW8_LYOSH|nr:putative P-loop containing nucleoside triphosphate hydrolase protein [Lyophyllum shimeji]